MGRQKTIIHYPPTSDKYFRNKAHLRTPNEKLRLLPSTGSSEKPSSYTVWRQRRSRTFVPLRRNATPEESWPSSSRVLHLGSYMWQARLSVWHNRESVEPLEVELKGFLPFLNQGSTGQAGSLASHLCPARVRCSPGPIVSSR